jgi:peptidoglycan/xylan/chitin deacetylase (PgdA/CDA1 family)
MEALAIVVATSAGGRRLARLVEKARVLSAAAGAPSVIALHGRAARAPRPACDGDVRLVVHATAGGAGAALVTGVRCARAARCLLADDELCLDARLVLEHRRPPGGAHDVVTVGDLVPRLPDGRAVPAGDDLLCVFALQGARQACVPRAGLAALREDETLDDPVAAYRLARRLQAAGTRFVPVDTPVPAGGRDRGARERGRAAARLYAEDPTTLAASGLGNFRQVPVGRLLIRRALAAVPGTARGTAALARAVPAPPLADALRRVGADALFWRGARGVLEAETWRRVKSSAVILMYHAFTPDPKAASRYVLPARRLAGQLIALRALRRHVMPLEAYVRLRQAHALAPARTVVLTIDDGYADVYDVAAPILAGHVCPATVFVVSGLVGGRAGWPRADSRNDRPLRGRRLADWQRIREGVQAGLDVGAHTRSHPPLTRLGAEAAAEEIAGSRRELGERLQRAVTLFAYPHGDEDARVRGLVAEAGFDAACTSRGGSNGPCEPLTALRRVEVRGDERLWRFAATLLLARRLRVRTGRRRRERDA